MDAITALDLEPIKVKLMHQASGEGWSLERANAVECEYRRFLMLMKKYPHEATSPLVDVDTFWHYHILDTMKYALDCDAVFGYFLHHFPYIGMRGADDEATLARLGQRMQQLYEAEFGQAYVRTDPAYCGMPPSQASSQADSPNPPQNAYCGMPPQQVAYCGMPTGKVAYCGMPGALLSAAAPASGMYTTRPLLS